MPYPHLFSPLSLGKILKSRLVMSQMTMNYATEEGLMTERLIRHYLERARGGVGLILLEGTFFTPEGRGYKNQLGLINAAYVKGLRELTRAIHAIPDGPKVFIQVHHSGWRASSKLADCLPSVPRPSLLIRVRK